MLITEPRHDSQERRLERFLRAHPGEWVRLPHGRFGVANSHVAGVRKRVRDEGLEIAYHRLPNKPDGSVDGEYCLRYETALRREPGEAA